MEIKIQSLVEGAKDATGIVVIIDVLRACTTTAVLLSQGMEEIVAVREPSDAEPFKATEHILIGEGEHGSAHNIFDYNNSPSEVLGINFTGRKGVLRSNNATQAILNAEQATEVILASFVNINAIVNYIKKHHLKEITIVPLGRLGGFGIEDELCAQMIKNLLLESDFNFESASEEIRSCDTAILVRETLGKPKDVEMALMLNAFDIVPRIFVEKGQSIIRKVS